MDATPKKSIPASCFSVTVVCKGDKFLLVQERKHGQKWYLPAGRLEPGEDFAEAAKREALEETGIPISLTGIIRIDTQHKPTQLRFRAIFLAKPVDDRPPKSVADGHSLRAGWFSRDELAKLDLRGSDVKQLVEYKLMNYPIFPLGVLGPEGQPYDQIACNDTILSGGQGAYGDFLRRRP